MINNYLSNLNARFKTGIATEHTYRGDLQTLLEVLAPGTMATNEPARIKCGAPDYITTTYPIGGDNTVTRSIGKKDFDIVGASLVGAQNGPQNRDGVQNEGQAQDLPLQEQNQTGRVWINDTQYFDNIPVTAWEFYIGGYQPAKKWLKDRKGRVLSYDDITHYQKIIVALTETARIMGEIDKL